MHSMLTIQLILEQCGGYGYQDRMKLKIHIITYSHLFISVVSHIRNSAFFDSTNHRWHSTVKFTTEKNHG